MTKNIVNIAIVDDSRLNINGWYETLKERTEVNIVGTALNKDAFLEICRQHQNELDILLMDKNIDGKTQFDDFTFIKEVRDEFPKQKIIVYTWDYYIGHIEYLRQINVNGYLPSKLATDLMPQAIKSVMDDHYYFPRDGVLKDADRTDYNNSREFDIEFLKLVNSLTPGQNKVACLLAHDMLNPQIANVLDISVKGVENHVRKIYEKLNIFPDEEQARSKFNHYFGEYFRTR